MMVVPSTDDIDVQIEKGIRTESTQKFFDQLKAKPPNGACVVRCLIVQIGSAAQIDGDLDKSFIHREEEPTRNA